MYVMATAHLRLNFMFSEAENMKLVEELKSKGLIRKVIQRPFGMNGDLGYYATIYLPNTKTELEIIFSMKFKTRVGEDSDVTTWDDSSKVEASLRKGLPKRVNWLAINAFHISRFTDAVKAELEGIVGTTETNINELF
jgi:hypothetical protein